MKIKKFAYFAFVALAAVAFILGSAIPSEAAAKKKKMAAAPAPQSPTCWVSTPGPVCATKGGQKFTSINSCYAAKDGASAAKPGQCKAAAKGKKSAGKKKMSKKRA